MRKPREAKRSQTDSQRLRNLVRDALYDEGTYLDDGPFDERERASSGRHALEVRRLLAGTDPSEEDARFLHAAIREPGVDANRAVLLISECLAVQHLREPFWSQCLQRLVSDPEPRVRILAIRANAYSYEAAIDDKAPEVRIAALHYGWQWHAILRKALRDADAKVRKHAASQVLALTEWREECARLSTDPDESVRAEAQKQLAVGIKAQK